MSFFNFDNVVVAMVTFDIFFTFSESLLKSLFKKI